MGRLFWKFFFSFVLATMLSGAAVAVALFILYPRPDARAHFHAGFLVDTVATLLRETGSAGVKPVLLAWQQAGQPVPLVIDAQGKELLGRDFSAQSMKQARQVRLGDGSAWLVFLDEKEVERLDQNAASSAPPASPPERLSGPGPGFDGDPRFADGPHPPPGEDRRHFPSPPVFQFISGLLGALAFSALLAWYLSKPVRHLRRAFDEVAAGKLETRVEALMGGRRDEIADLGRGFDHMAAALQKLMGAQRRLLHDVSHELRSPLARLSAAIGLLRQDPGRMEATLARIEHESERLDQLVGELLSLSRLEAGAEMGARVRIELAEFLVDIADDARFEGQVRGCDVVLQGSGPLPVDAHAELLYRAFDNVLRNAVKHSPDGGVITVTMAQDAEGRSAVVSVCDQGSGVAAGEIDHIFTPFYRGERSNGQGFGLGLAIARRSIEAHGGSIRAFNHAPGGLCVEITLPLA